jgi:hypothetical protein
MALNKTQIIQTVLRRCGGREADTVMTGYAETELDLTISELESEAFLPWFLISDETQLTINLADRNVSLPSDFLREYEDEDVWYYNADNSPTRRKLEKVDKDDLTQWGLELGPGEPELYALVGSQFILDKEPDAAAAAGNIKFRYYARGAQLSSAVLTNVWTLNADWLLVQRLGGVMARQYIRDFDLATAFEEQAKTAWFKLQQSHVAREQANRRAQMGGSDR